MIMTTKTKRGDRGLDVAWHAAAWAPSVNQSSTSCRLHHHMCKKKKRTLLEAVSLSKLKVSKQPNRVDSSGITNSLYPPSPLFSFFPSAVKIA